MNYFKVDMWYLELSVTLNYLTGIPPPPSIGDIRLVPYTGDPSLRGFYEPMIYYTDGLNKADFGGACADKSYQDEGTVICRQLGYALDKFQYR